MKIFKIFKAILLCFNLSIYSIIIESPTTQILKFINFKKALLVWDIDNTLIAPIGFRNNKKWVGEGSDEWFTALMEKELGLGLTYKQAVSKWLPTYNQAQRDVIVKIVENESAQLIKDLQKSFVPMIGLTYRSDELSDVIVKQLNSVDIDLSVTAPCKEHLAIKYEPSPEKPTCLHKGIMLCNGNDKGQILRILLKKINFHPELVVCVDDKIKYLHSIENVLQEMGIEFLGIRYSRCDERVRSFRLR